MQSALHKIVGPQKEIHDLHGRTAVITGGALGIGYEVARAFALHGARVIMVNRKEEQGQDAIQKIKEESENKADVDWVGCDLGNLKEVKEVFTGIQDREEHLDLVLLSSSFVLTLN